MYPNEHPTDNCNRHYGLLLERRVDIIHVFNDQLILASEWGLPKVLGA
jgi:hypothetical protein